MIRYVSGSSFDRFSKKLYTLFQDNELKITVLTGKTSIIFVDINFCLNYESCQQRRKPNDEQPYIGRNSSHPPAILSGLPLTISERISSLHSSCELFSKAAPMYNAALENAAYVENFHINIKNQNNIHIVDECMI